MNVQPGKPAEAVDHREALYNDGAIGPIAHIQVSTDRIVQLRGILFDVDPGLYRTGPLLSSVPPDPRDFCDNVVGQWLARDTILSKAEVRNSGTGLHLILWFDAPVVFETDGERDRWAGVVQVVQAALPVDPEQPGLTAVTRPVGSMNSKNGAAVELLKPGTPVTANEVLALYGDMCKAPFRTVMSILADTDRLTPCPICQNDGTTLSALDYQGCCYGGCGAVKLEKLYDLVLVPYAIKRGGPAQ